MKKNGKLIIAAVAVLVLAAVFAGVWAATRPAASQGAKTITVEVVHKDESSKTFTYHTDAEYLGEVLQAEGLVRATRGITACTSPRWTARPLSTRRTVPTGPSTRAVSTPTRA